MSAEKEAMSTTVAAYQGEVVPWLSFQVGAHLVGLSPSEGRWTVTVDGAPLEAWHESAAAAWEAGVREADRIDRVGPA